MLCCQITVLHTKLLPPAAECPDKPLSLPMQETLEGQNKQLKVYLIDKIKLGVFKTEYKTEDIHIAVEPYDNAIICPFYNNKRDTGKTNLKVAIVQYQTWL